MTILTTKYLVFDKKQHETVKNIDLFLFLNKWTKFFMQQNGTVHLVTITNMWAEFELTNAMG